MKLTKAIEIGYTQNPRTKRWGITSFNQVHGICIGCQCDMIYTKSSKGLYCDTKCANKHISKISWTPEKITEFFEKEGYDIIPNQEIRYNKQIKYICPNKHKHNIQVSNFISGQRCGLCIKNKKLSYNDVVQIYKDNGYTLLTKEEDYLNCAQLVNVLCDKGHNWSCHTYTFNTGVRCLECSGNSKIEFSTIKSDLESEGYTVLTKEENFESQVKTKIDFICDKGHTHKISYRKWRKGQRCGKCGISKEERDLKNELTNLGIIYEENDRTQLLNPKTNHYLELDIWIPEKKIGIEYNGNYWHSREDKINNDEMKHILCEQLDIKLFTVTENDWYDKKVVLNKILTLYNSQ